MQESETFTYFASIEFDELRRFYQLNSVDETDANYSSTLHYMGVSYHF